MIAKCPATGEPVPIESVRVFRSLDTLTPEEIEKVHALWKRKSRTNRGSSKHLEEQRYKKEARRLVAEILEVKP